MPVLRRLLPAVLVLGAIVVPAAQASPEQASIMMDDDQLLYRSDNVRARTLVRMKTLGVDAVRVSVLWRVAAELARPTPSEIAAMRTDAQRQRARRQLARFRADDPRTYPTRNWDRYDNLVKEASANGLRVFFTITGPGPAWAHRTAPPSQRLNRGTFKPFPSRFRDFVEAVGKRFSGTYRDENGTRAALPRVSFWSLWNEPNQAGWLSPQWERRQGQLVPASPALYRKLFQAGRQGLDNSGHGSDPVLIGETAPLGTDRQGPRTAMRPALFLRELGCVSPAGAPYAGPDAARRDCDDFTRSGPLRATGYAHHPYTKGRPPDVPPRHADELTMANLPALGAVLDGVSAASGGALPGGLPIFLTEFGYESNPPDPRNGISLNQQADYAQLGELLAYSDPRVLGMTQFLLRDAGPLTRYRRGSGAYWFTYQSGLFTRGGRPKPAAFAYALPFRAFKAGVDAAGNSLVGFWGQLRFRPNGSPDLAVIRWRPNASTPFVTISAGLPVDARGFFTATIAAPGPGGDYQAAYVEPASGEPAQSSLPTRP